MAINNINTLQKLAYTGTNKDMQTYSDIYLKQSLANLGQRFSVKGDGVSVGKFSIYELFKDLPVPTEEDFSDHGKLYEAYMMATVTTDPDDGGADIVLTAYNVKDSEMQPYSESIVLSEEDYAVASSDVYMQGTKVKAAYNSAKIAYYAQNGIVTREKDNYSMMMLTYDTAKTPLDITIDRYDNKHTRIIEGIHIYNLQNSTYVTTLTYINSSSYTSYYHVAQYSCDDDMMSIYEMLLDDGTSPVMSNKRHWKPSDVVDALELNSIGECKATFDFETQYLSCDSDTFENAFHSNTLQGDIVEANILEWNDSLALAFPFFKHWYNEQSYFNEDDNLKLKKRITAEVIVALWDNFKKESEGSSIDDAVFIAFMPYEYTFIYTCNSNRPSQIFTSNKDITVESIQHPENELWKIYKTGNDGVREQLIICSSWDDADSTEDIFSVWKYYVTYDQSDVVQSISVERSFVLPYINDDGYWNINNVDTSIYARGKDGGQPSLIISYADTYLGTKEILSTMNKDELTTALSWEMTYYRVRPLDTSSAIGEATFHMMATYMPVNISTSYLPENLVTFLENAIIMSISSVHSEQVASSTATTPLAYANQLGENATITTFWALQKDAETNEYTFSYVKQPDSAWAIDFNYLTDAEAIVKYYMQLGIEPDLYKHSWLVFDGVSATLKNQENPDKNKTAYPTMMNRLKDYFTDMFDTETASMQYLNNTNFIPSFVTGLNMSGSYIMGVVGENPEKYFRFDDNGDYSYVPVIQVFGIPSSKSTVSEWYPNTRTSNTPGWVDTLLPMLDLKEMFIRNANVLNRYNILSTDEAGRMYYAYYGTSYEDANKSVIHLGTGTTDINLGLKTLTNEEQRTKFQRHSEIDIDFDTIALNGDVVMPKASWSMYKREGTDYKMYSTEYELAYVGPFPRTIDSLTTIVNTPTLKKLPYFRMVDRISYGISNIGNNTAVDGKTTYVSYLNVNWLAQDVLKIGGFTDTLLKTGMCNSYGDASELTWLLSNDGTPSYFLRLTTDIEDMSQRLREVESTMPGSTDIEYLYFIKMNPVTVSYSADYNKRTGIPIQCSLNIREEATTLSSAYTMYDGGELEG